MPSNDNCRDSYPRWECPECGTENEVDPAVVDLCVEHWTPCTECGNRVALKLRGKSA